MPRGEPSLGLANKPVIQETFFEIGHVSGSVKNGEFLWRPFRFRRVDGGVQLFHDGVVSISHDDGAAMTFQLSGEFFVFAHGTGHVAF